MRKWLVFLLLCSIGTVAKGQTQYTCQDGQIESFNYALNIGASTLIAPNQMTTVAATISVGASYVGTSLAPQSHNLTVTPGTMLNFSWQSYNAVSATSWVTLNGTLQSGNPFTTLSGTDNIAVPLHRVNVTYVYFYQATDASGHTTQDRVTISVVSGTVGEVRSSDSIASNFYFSFVGGAAGGLTGQECTGDQNHRGVYQVQLSNATSGESRPLAVVNGAQVCPFCSIPGTPVDSISMLPGDSLSVDNISVTIQMNCEYEMFTQSMAAPSIWFQQEIAQTMFKNNSPQTQLLPPWSETPYCSSRTTPPDLTVGGLVTNGNGTWQPALIGTTPCERFGGGGLGSGWICFTPLSQTLPTLPSTKPDCSNWDNGYPGTIQTNRGNGPQPRNPPKP